MKTLEELRKTQENLASTLPSDISDLETIIFSDMQKVMLEECLALTLVHTIDLAGKPVDFIRVPKELAPSSPLPPCNEGDPVTPRKFLLDKKDIKLTERWADGFSLARDSIEDSEVDLVTLGKDNMSKEFAQGLDDYLFSVLLEETSYTETIAGGAAHATYQLAHSPLVEVVSATDDDTPPNPVTVESQDEYQGKVKIAEVLTGINLVITYKASGHSLVVDAKTDGKLMWEDLSAGYDLARGHYETMKIVVVNSRGKSDIIGDTRFLTTFMGTGERSPMATNEIGMAVGMKIFVSSRVPEGCALLLDVNRFVWHVQKGGVKVSTFDQPASDVVDFYFFLRSGADVVDRYAGVLVTNLGSKSADL